MTEYVGRGDPRRSLALVWGVVEPPTRGPKPRFTIAEIASAAIKLADAEGLGALSMRRVAEALGTSAMSLYTYVPSKAELLDLVFDTVLAELPTDYPLDRGWRAAVEAGAREAWDFYQRHPWVLQISGARAVLGPHELDQYEASLRMFDDLGLTGVEMTRAVAVVSGYVRGAAKSVADARTAEQVTGISDDEWWNARAPLMEELTAAFWSERYPLSTRLDQEEHTFDQLERDPDDDTPYMVWDALQSFEFGLQRLLDGLEAYIATRAKAKPRRRARGR